MAMLKASDAVFYHPLDTVREEFKDKDWTKTDGVFISGKLSTAISGYGTLNGLSVGIADTVDSDINTLAVTRVDDTRIAVSYRDNGGTGGYTRIGEVGGTSVTWGSEYTFDGNTIVGTAIGSTAGNDLRIAMCWFDWFTKVNEVRVATVSASGTTISSWGSPVTFSASQITAQVYGIIPVDESHVIVAWRQPPGQCRVAALTGNTISLGGIETFEAGETSWISGVSLGTSRSMLCWREGSAPASCKVRIATVSGSALTLGPTTTVATDATGRVCSLSDTRVAVAYGEGGAAGKIRIGTVSGSTVSFGASTTFLASNPGVVHVAEGALDTVIVTYGGGVSSKVGIVSGDSVSFGSAVTVGGGSYLKNVVGAGTAPFGGDIVRKAVSLYGTGPGPAYSKVLLVVPTGGTGGAEISGETGDYDSVVGESAVAFAGWFKNPSEYSAAAFTTEPPVTTTVP